MGKDKALDLQPKIGRRLFLQTLVSTGMLCAVAPAFAQLRGGWQDQFDAGVSNGANVASNQPVLSFATVAYTQQAIMQYQAIVDRGGWPLMPTAQGSLRIGDTHPAIITLRQRLAISGDLASGVGVSQSFDTYVDAAVRRFQARHGLAVDGILSDLSYKAMNVNAYIRLQQLQINLERLTKKAEMVVNEPRFVMVNVPAAQTEAVEGGLVTQRFTAIVGKIDRQTPLLDSKITQIILNPFWTVPASIIRKDIIPLMQKNPSYLTDNNIHLYDRKGEEVLPENVNWFSDEAVSLRFRQDPGKNNAMSSTKINFSNPYAVYMHDTPEQSLFNNLMRFDSSGCIRIQNIHDLDQWILKNTPGWGREEMEAVIATRKNKVINIKDPIPLHFVYISAWSSSEGVAQFRNDVYHMDGLTELALDTAG